MVKERNLNNIYIKSSNYFPLKKNNKLKNVIGFDTETENGKCFLIGCYESEINKTIVKTKNFNDIIDFLFTHRFRNTNNFFYNLNYDFQAIVKHIPIENLKELSKYDKTEYKNILITYLPNKCLSLSYKRNTVKFFDIAQYYNFMSLKKAGMKYLNLTKESLKEDKINIKELSLKKYENDNEYKYYLDKYLFMDVRITKLLGDNILKMIKPYMIPKDFYSQATFSQQYFLENLKNKVSLPSKTILQYALNAYQGGRFEVFKKGYFKKGYIQDIKSAYPFHNIKVPNLTTGEWKKNKDYEPESLISLFKIDTDIHDIKISPLKYQLQNNLMIYPIGKFKDIFVNKQEIELLNDLGYKYKIDSAFHYFDKNPTYPYTFLNDFYELKEKYKQENKKEMSWIPKILMNGFYGKLIQMNPKLEFTKKYKGNKNLYDVVSPYGELIYVYKTWESGKLFNPIVANEITTNTRIQLFKNSFKHQKNIIGFQTDSIISDKKLNLDYSNNIGSWEMENKGEMVILGSGVYQILNSNKRKLRGFSKDLDLYNLLNDNRYKTNIKIDLIRNHKLKKTFKLKLSDTERLNKFNLIENEIKSININFDRKRVWERNFINCNDVLENSINSNPIII